MLLCPCHHPTASSPRLLHSPSIHSHPSSLPPELCLQQSPFLSPPLLSSPLLSLSPPPLLSSSLPPPPVRGNRHSGFLSTNQTSTEDTLVSCGLTVTHTHTHTHTHTNTHTHTQTYSLSLTQTDQM